MKNEKITQPRFSAFKSGSIALVCLLSLAGCVGSGGALRGVGAPTPPQAATAPAERAVLQTVAREDKLNEGTPLNVTVDAATSSQPLTPSIVPPAPQMASSKPQAVEQIRAKASATGNVKPNVFDIPKSSPNRLTATRQAESRSELEAAAAKNAAIMDSGEAQAKAGAAKKLKRQAQTHYDAALKEIEN